MSTFTNLAKNIASWTSPSKHSSSFSNISKNGQSSGNTGTPIGLLLALTQVVVDAGISWTPNSKNSASWNQSSKNTSSWNNINKN